MPEAIAIMPVAIQVAAVRTVCAKHDVLEDPHSMQLSVYYEEINSSKSVRIID